MALRPNTLMDVDIDFFAFRQYHIYLGHHEPLVAHERELDPYQVASWLLIGSRAGSLSGHKLGRDASCFFSRTVAAGRGFGLSWTQAELRLRTLITDRERLKLSLIGVCKPERKARTI
ncbi:hypothetical protein F2Q69_00048862 [Brassica cretica]|uniref:Uncharacterized protein n=1 Tax=Brassica cretica TaxID=69181 RepID=A0A8S9PUB0_BRACR|nr:hypothetical protein F2Q69_00048862 [Brassica cretica]